MTKTTPNHHPDIIIIGSGLGGLACGHILASEGYHVLILERESQPGGCMQSYRRNNLDFDTGLHYVGGLDKGPVYQSFRMLGLMQLPWVRMDENCFDRIHINGESYDFAQGYDNFVDTLAKRFPEERKALNDYISMLDGYSKQQLDLLRSSQACDLQTIYTTYGSSLSTSAWQWLNSHFHDSTLINVLSGNASRIELSKDTLPLYTLAHINSSYIASSWRLRGPGNLLVNKLLDGIRQHGGEVICNAEVEHLVEEDGHIVAAVCTNGERYEADRFISDIHPKLTIDLISESKVVKKSMRYRLDMMENTYGMLTVSLVIKPHTLPYVNHNEHIYARPNLWEHFEKDHPVSGVMVSYRVPEGHDTYVRQIDLLTPVDWAECKPWETTSLGHRQTNNNQDYNQWKTRKAEQCIDLAASVVPNLKEAIEAQYISTPLTYRDYTHTPCGSAFGLRKDCANPLLTFLSPRTPEPSLLLTGQSLMVHGVEGVTMTALITCAEIIGRQRMWEKLIEA